MMGHTICSANWSQVHTHFILNETVSGGYRKIATVITADLPILAQIKPEDSVFFQEVFIDDAYLALSELEGIIKRFKQGISR